MVYRKGNTWWARVRDCAGESRLCSTGTTLKMTAAAVEAWAKDVRRRLDPTGVLTAVVRGELTLTEAYRVGEAGYAAHRAAAAAAAADVDLTPLFAEWVTVRRQREKGARSLDKYVTQIAALYPERPWRVSQLAVPEVVRRLDALRVKDATRNRYRAALSAFCAWLVRTGVLETNPARLAGGYAESTKDVRFLSMMDARRVIEALPAAYRGREALMAGTGMDWSDTARVRVRDIDLVAGTVRCHGSKTPWRNRLIRITQPWVLPFVKAALGGRHPDALAFEGGEGQALREHKRACLAVGVLVTTLHEWRDTYAVAELQAGEFATVVAHQLGHKDASLVWKRYGRYVPQAQHYREARQAASATESSTREVRQA